MLNLIAFSVVAILVLCFMYFDSLVLLNTAPAHSECYLLIAPASSPWKIYFAAPELHSVSTSRILWRRGRIYWAHQTSGTVF